MEPGPICVSDVVQQRDVYELRLRYLQHTRNCWHTVERTHDWELEPVSSLQHVQY